MSAIECAGFLFYSNFDSGNLAKVEWVPKHESAVVAVNRNGKETAELPDLEFNIWTKPDCMGTEFENGNRTWFYFGIKGYLPSVLMKLNLVDLNRQAKMYSQGMAPVYKLVPGRPNWERIRDKPTFSVDDNIFTLSFKFRTPENIDTIMYFAFTFPYTYTELQSSLLLIDKRFLTKLNSPAHDDIYYTRECVCRSIENRRIDLITISSYYNITSEREIRLQNLFPDETMERPFKFQNKKVIFISARVHPGETPSSFVFNGLLNILLNRDDPHAIILRRLYVFKMIPFLNPDGVVRGHYRTDTRGVNLNRMYLSPKLVEHPSVYAARVLIQYYHCGFECEIEEKIVNDNNLMTEQVQVLSLNEEPWNSKWQESCNCDSSLSDDGTPETTQQQLNETTITRVSLSANSVTSSIVKQPIESGLFLYIDMHGHASKKGIFMYGNHFDDVENSVECMLLPKIISLNNHNFHFTACNFTERNMYLRDRRDGMSREGSGRVAVLKLTGLVRSYTLECNYNSGRIVNVLPPAVKDGNNRIMHTLPLPPKYTPPIYEEVGKAIAISILDLSGNNPNSRIPNSEFHTLHGLREWLRVNCINELGIGNRITMRTNKVPIAYNQTTVKTLNRRSRPNTTKSVIKKQPKPNISTVPVGRKENMIYPVREQQTRSAPIIPRIYNRTTTKTKNLSIRTRMKRDSGQQQRKGKFLKPEHRPTTSKVRNESDSPKRIKVVDNNDRLKLREICLMKDNHTKKLIAKFTESGPNSDHDNDDDDDLVVAWDSDYNPKVLTKPKTPEPSTSTKQTTRNFVTKSKRTKGTLRRFGSSNIETGNKIEKIKKRKKLKTKLM